MANSHIIIGSPYQVGDRVQVVRLTDETEDPDTLHKVGTVEYLSFPRDISATFPHDPYISVSLDDGTSGEFWKEELIKLPDTTTEAPGL